ARFGYADCPGPPGWLPPTQQPDRHHSLWLIANQPATRLHSQLDFGQWSARHKQKKREICQMHPLDAAKRAIHSGDIVKIFNQRGALLACARVTEDIMPGVIQVPTGAWFDPLEPLADAPFCVHGNPNVVTFDEGTSSLAQGCTGQIAIVELVKFEGVPPPVKAFIPPRLSASSESPPEV
ncbi:molybdopterin dinucleotide binding domain-containing protein, partial [Citrobacter amalonaticus]|uniref:molybdopterin dinucleotide binding domain-containing protein n=1 Tax=Citrobacter amalonaticus TaxID=35703 RepID=UPI000B0D05E4